METHQASIMSPAKPSWGGLLIAAWPVDPEESGECEEQIGSLFLNSLDTVCNTHEIQYYHLILYVLFNSTLNVQLLFNSVC